MSIGLPVQQCVSWVKRSNMIVQLSLHRRSRTVMLSSLLVTPLDSRPSASSRAVESTASAGLHRFQKPSQAISRNRSCVDSSKEVTLGVAEAPIRLNCKSPKDLETSSRPASLPSCTAPPAFSMRALSAG
eukprot:scaffold153729_cov42-Prasinocladus_malaysianus.AAC.2